MKSRKVEIGEGHKEEIRNELGKAQAPHVYKRPMTLKLRAIDGVDSKQVAEYVGLNISSVNGIIRRYQEQGLESLISKRHNHGNRYMTLEEEGEFLQRFQAREASQEGVGSRNVGVSKKSP